MPLIARWKGRIAPRLLDDRTVLGAVDLFPTFCALAGVDPPEVDFDGEDMSAALLGEPRAREKPLIWEYGRDETFLQPGLEDDRSPNLAIRYGRWKLLINDDGSRLELYDFDHSTDERENVADRYPMVAEKLAKQLLEFRRSLPTL